MSILDPDALAASPLADLHALASELSIDGYRRLRKAELIDAIIARQGGEPAERAEEDEDDRPSGRRGRRGRRGGRGRSSAREEDGAAGSAEESAPEDAPTAVEEVEEVAEVEEPEETAAGGGRGAEREEEIVEGEVELLANGSGFLRVSPPEPSEDDVYVSAAQVKRCELVPGDRISGPRRPPRRSERFASLVRIDTINGRPADEVADSTRFEDLPAAFPSERFRLGSDDPTIKAIEWLTPFGQGSRVTIAGPARAGKTEALRRLAEALSAVPDIQLSVVLAGVRPEEIAEWQLGPVTPAAGVSFAASADAQAQTIERVVDQGRRLAARGSHAVVLIDTVGGLQPHAARKLLAAARNVAGGGSLTVIATASEPLGGETTVIALDPLLAITGRFPAVDLLASWTIRAELLVGQAGAEAIARARVEALEA
ncbi:MAG TPA: Rho termination factor N-terminal domain-containing protein [Solirubrobacteraceae bacterium]|nr:Rho termination factor N-terminal domain-containing protein [Solirubrobacteraceae bacterium]